MMKFKFGLCSFMFGLMLGSTPAWADVDISQMQKVEVGSWGELKAAVEDSANAGKVIVLTGDIQADADNPITSAGGSGIIIDGGGFTITGQEGSSSDGRFISFDKSDTTDLIIQNVKLEGFGNVRTGSSYAQGGAIYNGSSDIGNISGIFTGNYAQGEYAYGGAIYNNGTIGDIIGDFTGNYVQGKYANGGAIYNNGTIGDITGDFSGNYAQSTSGSSYAEGGAIFNYSGAIGDITGDFTGNYVQGKYANGGAIYNYSSIGDITGDFSKNYAKSDSGSAIGGAIDNYGGTIGNITGDFSGNYAISTSANAYGGAISNNNRYGTIGDISGNFTGNYAQSDSSYAIGGAIDNNGTIGDISGIFTGNYAQGEYAYGGAIYNNGTIGDIIGDFTGNYVQGKYANGGAIYNNGTIGDITGDFSGNYTQGSSYAQGGAIYNSWGGTIGDITGDFSGNYAKSDSGYAQGGAIYNDSQALTFINSSFYDNFVETGTEKESEAGQQTLGGAIYSESDLVIKADNGQSIFSGNKIKWANGEEESSAIYLAGTSGNKLSLNASNNGLIQFDDKISAYAENPEDILAQKFYGATITEDGEGGYYVEQNGEIKHYKKFGSVYKYYEDKVEKNETQISEEEAQQQIQQIKDKNYDIKQDGENYIVSGKQDGIPVMMEMIKQSDGTYNMTMSAVYSQEQIDALLQDAEDGGAIVTDDGNGGYIVEIGAEAIHISKTENGFAVPMEQQGGISSAEVQALIEEMKKQNIDIVQDGENYSYTQEKDGKKIVTQYIKQSDGNYAVIVTTSWTESDSFTNLLSTMTITGDSSSKVVFNNAIEKVAKIDISGTNVDVNEGAGTIYRTVTHDGGVLNINAGAKAEDSIINSGGALNVADKAEINRTEVNEGGVLNVAAGGLAQDTTVNSGGKLSAEAEARLNNMLANGGAILDIDSGAVLTGNIIIHADAEMGGSYDYSKIFKDEVTEDGSLTLVGGLNGAMTESSLVNTTEGKRLHLTAGDYAIGDGAQAVEGWDMLTFKDNANVKLEGDITLTGPNKKLIIENGSNLNLAGNSPSNYTITGSVSNDGSMTFTHAGDDADDITTIYGNYTAYNNAQMTIDVNPTDNTSDLLRVDGDVSGTTNVVLNIVGADIRPTELIKFVEAANDDLSTGAYFNIFRVDGSAFNWNSLYKDGAWYTATDDIISDDKHTGYGDDTTGALEDDENLEDDAVLPPNFPDTPSSKPDNGKGPSVVGEAIAYMGLPSAGIEQTRDMTRNITNKVASTKVYSQQCHGFYDCEYDGKALRNAWAAPVYSYSDVKAPYSYEAEISGFEGGFDIQSDVYNRLGVFASYRQGSYDFDGDGDDYYSKVGADMDIDSYILGLYHRYDEGKMWTMGQIFLGYQDVSLSSDDGVSSSTDGIEFGAAVEGGLIFNPMTNLTIEPIIRLAYTQINYDDATDNYGKTAKYDDVRNIEVEAGVKVEKTYLRKNGYAKLYVKPSIIQNIGSGDVQVTSLRKVDGLENSTLGRIEVGGSMSFDEQWSGYANAAYTFGSDYTNAAVNAGLNYAF